jgi:hypothetical protein
MKILTNNGFNVFNPKTNEYNDSEYVLVSTSKLLQETYVFPADEEGNIKKLEILAEVVGTEEDKLVWMDHQFAIEMLSINTGHTYGMVKFIESGQGNMITQRLYKRTDL